MTSQPWHDSDEFWAAVASAIFPPERLEAAEFRGVFSGRLNLAFVLTDPFYSGNSG